YVPGKTQKVHTHSLKPCKPSCPRHSRQQILMLLAPPSQYESAQRQTHQSGGLGHGVGRELAGDTGLIAWSHIKVQFDADAGVDRAAGVRSRNAELGGGDVRVKSGNWQRKRMIQKGL